ncbi:MAG: PIN domain nuclease [Bacteroidetes bacterium]|nr:MAG: PIN domain nuclease [Bacteroidota bacterium]
MNRFLFDSSVWIDFLRGKDTPQTSLLESELMAGDPWICPVIIQEVLQGIRDDKDYAKVKRVLTSILQPEWSPLDAAILAADIYRKLRRQGITIRRSNDCLIAAYALHFDLTLVDSDIDFEKIAQGAGMKRYLPAN